MYEEYTDKKGKKKKRRREVPPGLSARDVKILKSVQRRAHYLDKGFKICGMRFGWTFVVGLIPGLGDVADILFNYVLVLRKSRQAELPFWLIRQMLVNNAISAGVGLVPFAGDVVLAAWKANSRNANLLEEFLRIRGNEYLKLKAEGKDAYQIGTPKPKGKKGKEVAEAPAGGLMTNKAGTKLAAAKGTSPADAEQIKPGAGKRDGELVSGTGSGKKSATTVPDSSLLQPPPTGPTPVVADAPVKSKGGFMRGWKGKNKSDQGKFVEDVHSGSSGGASGSSVVPLPPKN